MCIKKRVLELEQLQFPFMSDLNQRLYSDHVLLDFKAWHEKCPDVPQADAFELYAHSMTHSRLGQNIHDIYFSDSRSIIPLNEYLQRLNN